MEVDYLSIIQSVRETAQRISTITIHIEVVIIPSVSRRSLLLLVVKTTHTGGRIRRSIETSCSNRLWPTFLLLCAIFFPTSSTIAVPSDYFHESLSTSFRLPHFP